MIAELRKMTVVISPRTNSLSANAVMHMKQERMLQVQKDIEIASACLSLMILIICGNRQTRQHIASTIDKTKTAISTPFILLLLKQYSS